MLSDVGHKSPSSMFLPHNPSIVGDLKAQLSTFATKSGGMFGR